MVSLQSLDIVIGMVIVFLTVSLVCSSINEAIATTLALRANTLLDALESLLGSDLAKELIDHPAIPAAPNGGAKAPAYIDPTLFASALLDAIIPPHDPAAPATAPAPGEPSPQFAAAHAAISAPAPNSALAKSPARRSLSALLRTANGDYAKLQNEVASWFNAYMDRVSGEYKRQTQVIIAIVAVCVVGILNIDSYKIYKQLANQPAYTAALVAKGDALVAKGLPNSTPSSIGAALDNVNAKIAALPVPIGWHHDDAVNPWWLKVIGLLITAIAASLGAPFWFDVLGKLANLRSAGTKPADS